MRWAWGGVVMSGSVRLGPTLCPPGLNSRPQPCACFQGGTGEALEFEPLTPWAQVKVSLCSWPARARAWASACVAVCLGWPASVRLRGPGKWPCVSVGVSTAVRFHAWVFATFCVAGVSSHACLWERGCVSPGS